MPNSREVLLIVRASPVTEIAISDNQFHIVSSAVGELQVKISPGLYALRAREAGATNYVNLILRADDREVTIDLPPVAFASSAPLNHTTTTHKWHQDAAMDLSRELLREHQQGIFVFAREAAPSNRPGDLMNGLTLHDPNGVLLLDLMKESRRDDAQRWAACAAGLEPGMYCLRSTKPNGESLTMPLIVSRGRFLHLFLLARSDNTVLEPHFGSVTIFISRDREFRPDHPGRRTEALVQEAMRTGRRVPQALAMIEQHRQWIADDAPILGLCLGYLALFNLDVDTPRVLHNLHVDDELRYSLYEEEGEGEDEGEEEGEDEGEEEDEDEDEEEDEDEDEEEEDEDEDGDGDGDDELRHRRYSERVYWQVRRLVNSLRVQLGNQPDVAALSVSVDPDRLFTHNVNVELLPMLAASWREIVSASYRSRVLVAHNSWLDRVAETAMATPLWLAWSRLAPVVDRNAHRARFGLVSALLDIQPLVDAVERTRELSSLASRIAHAFVPSLDPHVRDLERRYHIPDVRKEWSVEALGHTVFVPMCTLERGITELCNFLFHVAAESSLMDHLVRIVPENPLKAARLGAALATAVQHSRPRLAFEYLVFAGDLFRKYNYKSQAIVSFQDALRLDAQATHVYAELADIYIESGDNTALAEILVSHARINNDPELLHKAAEAWARAGQQTKAVPLWEEVLLRTESRHEHAFHALASMYEDIGEWTRLARLLESRAEISESSKERADLLVQAAYLYRDQLEDLARAIELYQHVLRVDPESAPAYAALQAIERERVRGSADLSDRRGYDSQFISGYKIPLPSVPPILAAPLLFNPGAIELSYEHFSLVMNARRRMPVFSALNIASGIQAQRPFVVQPRRDARIEDRFVLWNSPMTAPMVLAPLTRGKDAAWGEPEEARRALIDTHFVTNFVAQHKRLSECAEFWEGVEQKIQHSLPGKAPRLSVFQGPICRDNDPTFNGVVVPVQFWKIVVWSDSRELQVVGLIVSQQQLLEHPLTSRVYQWRVSVATIAAETSLAFPEVLAQHDSFDPSWKPFRRILRWGDVLPASSDLES